jgi:RimJ/RimL family protein N-acetyltransferase
MPVIVDGMKPGTLVYKGVTRKGTPIAIRYPKLSDAPAFLKYINALSSERTFILAQGRKFTLSEEKKWLGDNIKNIERKRKVMLAVFAGKELIGSASVDQESDAVASQGSFHIAVAKKFRGEGIGKLLMKLTLEEAKRNLKGLKIVTLNVFANNPLAAKLYKKFGFKKFGSLPKSVLHRGKYIANDYMYKRV